MKYISLVFICTFFTISAFAQSNPLDKKMEKAYSLVEKNKIEEADKYMVKLLEENPEYGPGWDYLCKIRFKEYKDSKLADNLLGGNITVKTTGKDGKEEPGSDSLSNALMEMLNNIKPSKKAFSKYKYTMRKAMLTSQDAYSASALLRTNFIDIEIDTAVSNKALKYYREAEEEFEKKNLFDAAKLYKRALEEQPDFYKAALYLGDCYYFQENYPEAVKSFKSAVDKFPNLLEPRKYLIDSYLKQKLYSEAVNECIAAMAVYPDMSVVARMEDAAYANNTRINIKWTPRSLFPNVFVPDTAKIDLNEYTDSLDAIAKKPWTHYQNALASIKGYCNEKGVIVKSNSLTQAKYLEVYSWEEMLKNSTDPVLEEARKMQTDGYLDCYVLVSCFHFDFYDQYSDFVSKNKARIKEYYKKYTTSIK